MVLLADNVFIVSYSDPMDPETKNAHNKTAVTARLNVVLVLEWVFVIVLFLGLTWRSPGVVCDPVHSIVMHYQCYEAAVWPS